MRSLQPVHRAGAIRPLALLAVAIPVIAGCYRSLDIPNIPCDLARPSSCPKDYVCTLVEGVGPRCRRPADASADGLGGITEAGSTGTDAQPFGEAGTGRRDGAWAEAGGAPVTETGGGARLDGGGDLPPAVKPDVPLPGSETGTGGASGTDAPMDAAADMPLPTGTDSGAGGGVGAGGTGGTAGMSGSGGGTGAGGALGIGSPCTAATECESGKCASGVCCNETCGGCSACKQALTTKPDGTCAPVVAGTDPNQACADETASNQCGNDGLCDGKGACRKVGTSHVCTPSSCDGSAFVPASTCDGLGACSPVAPTDCGTSQCSPTDGCQTTCTTDGNCVGASYCDSITSTCKAKKIDGEGCGEGRECASGYCVDGVCCHTACSGCNACATLYTGQPSGTCAPATADTDPHDFCAVDDPPCGHDGNCDGAGACGLAAASTVCIAGTCTGSTYTPAAYCTGLGTCGSVTSTPCPNNLACAGDNQCKTTCSSSSDCAEGFGCPSAGSPACTTVCGNGSREGAEECDDGNTITTDGCDACHLSAGWACEGSPSACLQVIYVNAAATGANDGTTWTNAYTSLTTALAAATAGRSVWIAQGTYKPTTTGDRMQSFILKDGVPVYGGFLGNQIEERSARDWKTHATILTGDLNGDDGANFTNNGENSYHVLTAASGVIVLDGLTIRGGNANHIDDYIYMSGGGLYAPTGLAAATIRNSIFEGNSADGFASGAWTTETATTTIRDVGFRRNSGSALVMGASGHIESCTFEENTAPEGAGLRVLSGAGGSLTITRTVFRANTGDGALVHGGSGDLLVVNSLFDSNTCATFAAAVKLSGGSPANFTNTVFLRNVCSTGASALRVSSGTVYFRNSTVAFGTAGMNPILFNTGFTGQFHAYNSIFRDSTPGSQINIYAEDVCYCVGYQNLDCTGYMVDPLLDANGVPAANSPACNAGNNTYLPADVADVDGDGDTAETLPLDYAGNARVQGGTVDIGAYEVK